MVFVLVVSPPIAGREVGLHNLRWCKFAYQIDIRACVRHSNNFVG